MIEPGNIKYYAANGEDCLLWQFFDYQDYGVYADIGAFDGVHFSNTYSFELQGWRGVCVEPHPAFYPILQEKRPQAICVEAACVGDAHASEVTIYCEELGLLSSIHKTEDYEKFVMGRYQGRGLPYTGLKATTVPAFTINRVLEDFLREEERLDFISIDVEGAELQLLKGFDVARFRPRVIVIESNHPEQTKDTVAYFAQQWHYIYAGVLMENLFFVPTMADVEKLRSIPIACFVEPQMHPRGEHFTPPKSQNGFIIPQDNPRYLKW